MTTVRIGEAAAAVGVPTHVLRHWEDVGAVTPTRLGNGHRVYDDDTLTQARLVPEEKIEVAEMNMPGTTCAKT